MNNKIIKSIFICLLGVYASAGCTEAQPDFNLKIVSAEHIENLAHKFCEKYSHKRNLQRLTYVAIAAAVLGGVAWLVYDGWYREKPQTQKNDDARALIYSRKWEEDANYRGPWGGFKKQLTNGFIVSACTLIIKGIWDSFELTTNGAKAFLTSNELSDIDFYRNKQTKIRDFLLKLAKIRELKAQNSISEKPDAQIDMLGVLTTDLIGTQRIFACFFEDLLAFVKFWTIMNFGEKSVQYFMISDKCLDLCADFNKVTAQMSQFINNIEQAPSLQEFSESYGLFGKKLTKFTFDCGLNFYGNDFLQQ